mgnify:CR=1 FL=1
MQSPAELSSGITLANMDTSVAPQQDFFRYVNGNWLDSTDIPADKARWGSFDELRENAEKQVLSIVQQLAAEHQLTLTDFYPMISGRVLAVNGENFADEATKEKPEQRQGVGRELNLTWLNQMPANNKLESGQWFTADSKAEVSVESQMAERLELKLGDMLQFFHHPADIISTLPGTSSQ